MFPRTVHAGNICWAGNKMCLKKVRNNVSSTMLHVPTNGETFGTETTFPQRCFFKNRLVRWSDLNAKLATKIKFTVKAHATTPGARDLFELNINFSLC